MEWLQVISLFLANAGLFMWMRSESRSDWRQNDAKIEANRQETNALITAIRDDIKDFHGRLCSLEERRR